MLIHSDADALCIDGEAYEPTEHGLYNVPDAVGLRLIAAHGCRRPTSDEVEALLAAPAEPAPASRPAPVKRSAPRKR